MALNSSCFKFCGTLFFIFTSYCCADALACSCVKWATTDQEWITERAYAESDIVFTGKFLSEESSQAYSKITTFDVAKVFKGDESTKQFKIYQGYCNPRQEEMQKDEAQPLLDGQRHSLLRGEITCGSSCDYSFHEGGEYLVYGKYYEEKLTTDECARTKLISEAAKDLETLEKIIATPNWKFDESKTPKDDLLWGK